MQHALTPFDLTELEETVKQVQINGTAYVSVAELANCLGVSRQTLWRWRQDGLIPQGRKFRGRWVLFTLDEAHRICEYANRLEPIDGTGEVKE